MRTWWGLHARCRLQSKARPAPEQSPLAVRKLLKALRRRKALCVSCLNIIYSEYTWSLEGFRRGVIDMDLSGFQALQQKTTYALEPVAVLYS